jgi:hypothetical protein
MPPIGASTDAQAAAYASLTFTVPARSRGRDALATTAVPRPDARVEPEGGVVRAGDDLVLVLERGDGDHRPEGLAAVDLHLVGDVGQDRRRVDQGPDVGPHLATGEDAGASGDGVVDVTGDGLELVPRRQGAHLATPGELRRQTQPVDLADEPSGELVGDRGVDEEAFDRDAQLAGAREAAADRAIDGSIEVGILEDEHGVLAPELERGADEPFAGTLRRPACRSRSSR